jgi:primosomal protein N'
VEATTRRGLREFLDAWLIALHAQRSSVRWHLEVDPYEI